MLRLEQLELWYGSGPRSQNSSRKWEKRLLPFLHVGKSPNDLDLVDWRRTSEFTWPVTRGKDAHSPPDTCSRFRASSKAVAAPAAVQRWSDIEKKIVGSIANRIQFWRSMLHGPKLPLGYKVCQCNQSQVVFLPNELTILTRTLTDQHWHGGIDSMFHSWVGPDAT